MNVSEGVAFVTGGAQGIGRATVESLLEKGAKVVLADNNEKTGRETLNELRKRFGDCVDFLKCDVTNSDQFEHALNLAVTKFGKLDIVINNAGTAFEASLDASNLIDLNCVSIVRGTRLAMRHMSKARGGSGGAIINISSGTALNAPWVAIPTYSASKSFVLHFSRAMGSPLYYNTSGVRVISVCPGLTDTPLINLLPKLDSDYPGIDESLLGNINSTTSQKPESVGQGLVDVLEKALSGSVWYIGKSKKPREVHIKAEFGNFLY